MTIIEALKKKGSKGGNNIAEAIENLPMGGGENLPMGGSGGEGGVFLVFARYDADLDGAPSVLDKTWDEIVSAIKNTQMLIVLTEISGDVFQENSGGRNFIFPSSVSYNTLNDNQEPEKSIDIDYDIEGEYQYRRYIENEDGVLVQVNS